MEKPIKRCRQNPQKKIKKGKINCLKKIYNKAQIMKVRKTNRRPISLQQFPLYYINWCSY